MLVIGRKMGEYLVLNDNIFIKVLKGPTEESDKVKLAIQAPDDVKIVRGEIFGTREELQRQLAVVGSKKSGRRADRTRKEAEGAAL